ncbi:hypothetical protein [Desulfovibrio sp. JC022]|uniref:hypothetical protein n=1 Tax=Desulfovibrio sp. JC022 TaxID=2593642 RepID=UPI0013D1351B|nr:hypothetical protein [Desulfovibrio sp. JC022]NDV21764.1 hypothetical protein [Desulfovibrio sp. JC022]
MSETQLKLFSVPENKELIKRVRDSLDIESPDLNVFAKSRNSYLINLLNEIYESSEAWDELCQVNIEYIGRHFERNVKRPINKSELDLLYSYFLRFACEFYLSAAGLNHPVYEFIAFAKKELGSFDESEQDSIEYAISFTPIMVTKRIISGHELQHIFQFEEVTKHAENLKETWDKEIKDKQDKVNLLQTALEKQKTGYNFVGLHKGFNQLSTEKDKEKKWSFRWVLLLGVAILALIGFEFYYASTRIEVTSLGTVATNNYFRLIPMFSGVIVLLYFFRIALINYKSVKSQILQIELRKTLCQFIQNYSDYSKEIKAKDKEALAKFENIIFSGIVADEGNIPSTFDGLDQLTKLAKTIKSK